MKQIRTVADLLKLRDKAYYKMETRIQGNMSGLVQIKVAMGDCEKSASAKEIYDYLFERAEEKGLHAVITKTDNAGKSGQEPVVEVEIPGKVPVFFGNVDKQFADRIIDNYIIKGENVPGVISVGD